MWWNELLITAGILQWPIYGKNFPKYYNFGTLGVTLSHELTNAVDEIGEHISHLLFIICMFKLLVK